MVTTRSMRGSLPAKHPQIDIKKKPKMIRSIPSKEDVIKKKKQSEKITKRKKIIKKNKKNRGNILHEDKQMIDLINKLILNGFIRRSVRIMEKQKLIKNNKTAKKNRKRKRKARSKLSSCQEKKPELKFRKNLDKNISRKRDRPPKNKEITSNKIKVPRKESDELLNFAIENKKTDEINENIEQNDVFNNNSHFEKNSNNLLHKKLHFIHEKNNISKIAITIPREGPILEEIPAADIKVNCIVIESVTEFIENNCMVIFYDRNAREESASEQEIRVLPTCVEELILDVEMPPLIDDEMSVSIDDGISIPIRDKIEIQIDDKMSVSINDKMPVPIDDKIEVQIGDEMPVPIDDEMPVSIDDKMPLPTDDKMPDPIDDNMPIPINRVPVPVICFEQMQNISNEVENKQNEETCQWTELFQKEDVFDSSTTPETIFLSEEICRDEPVDEEFTEIYNIQSLQPTEFSEVTTENIEMHSTGDSNSEPVGIFSNEDLLEYYVSIL